jgi:Uma2 family endonuclease
LAGSEVRIVLAGDVVVPDVSYYRWAHLPRDARGRIAGYPTEPPDIAVEVRSPGQSARDLIDKCRWMVEHGVVLAILVDPITETVVEVRAESEERTLRGQEVLDLSSVLPDFRMSAAGLFEALYQ